ncbi:MAG: BamA/TamA family outer membrane protein [Candidatus Binatus sp.]|uniref:BamA/TamA family outer membrane protein n=1 Tax=Candidatus Binatus sp. TaxID=2811406 RepID=UPI003C7085F6
MRRVLVSLILITALVVAAPTAHADPFSMSAAPAPTSPAPTPPSRFSLMDPSTWSWPQYDWNSFKLQDPNSWPFIPVPEIATDPNGGVTYGVLPVWLFTDDKNQISSILAPDINANSTLGPGGNFRYLGYPSADTQWYVVGGAQETIARKVDLDYQTGREHKKWWSFEGRFYFERDPTERFFGTGNNSHWGNQTNYTTEQLYGEAIAGLNLTDKLQLSLMERPRYVRILAGGFTSLPDIHTLFPNQKGINGGSEVLSQAMIQYDSRDSVDIPRSGTLGRLYYGNADRRFGSSVSYNRFGGELRQYYSVNERITFAGHLFNEYEPAGGEMPFWSQARLGGQESLLTDQETLRGYGAGRYIDNNLFVMNLEMRTRVWDKNIFGTHGIVELAPFAEAGRVAHAMNDDPFSDLHPVGGIGLRGIAEPFVVGFVDVGWGGEGAAVFSGINYPF